MAKSPIRSKAAKISTVCSTHWYAVENPKLVSYDGHRFIEGTYGTQQTNHPEYGRRVLIPLEQVSSIVEFDAIDQLWSTSR
jgi:hypothetical protein